MDLTRPTDLARGDIAPLDELSDTQLVVLAHERLPAHAKEQLLGALGGTARPRTDNASATAEETPPSVMGNIFGVLHDAIPAGQDEALRHELNERFARTEIGSDDDLAAEVTLPTEDEEMPRLDPPPTVTIPACVTLEELVQSSSASIPRSDPERSLARTAAMVRRGEPPTRTRRRAVQLGSARPTDLEHALDAAVRMVRRWLPRRRSAESYEQNRHATARLSPRSSPPPIRRWSTF